MHFSTRNVGILASLVLSGAMVAVAFWLSSPSASLVSAESAEELLRAYAAQDSDTDGLADWQEALYGTDPKNPESVATGVLDGDAVRQGLVAPKFVAEESAAAELPIEDSGEAPGDDTLTARFARDFFGSYLSGRSTTPPTSDELALFVADAVAELSGTAGTRFSGNDLMVSGSGEDALRAYAARAEEALASAAIDTSESELVYFSNAVLKDDAASLELVRRIGEAYEKTAVAFAYVSVPAEAATAHLRTANAFSRLAAAISDMASFKEDPLRGFIGLQSYESAVEELAGAFAELGETFEGIEFSEGEAGASFMRVSRSVEE